MKKWITLVSLMAFQFPTLYAQSGWVQPKRSGFFKLSQYSIIADKYFTPAGDIVDITTTGFHSTNLYAEYGLTNKLTMLANTPIFVRSTLNRLERPDGILVEEGDELNSIGDIDLSAKYQILNKGSWVSAVTLTLGLPLGKPSGGRTGLLQSGDGEFNQLLTLSLSRSIGKTYANVLLAFNNRTQGFSDEFRYGAEIGANAGRFWFIARLYSVESLQNGKESLIVNNGIFSNNIEYISISPEIIFELTERVGFSAGAGFAPKAQRILAAPAFIVGVHLKK